MFDLGGSVLGLAILIADIYAILNVLQSNSSTGGKVLWTGFIIFMPLLGFIFWMFVGPRKPEL